MLKEGAMIVELKTGVIWGDLAHCSREDLLESARTLVALAPTVAHKGLWGFGKAYDRDTYVYTTSKSFKAPAPFRCALYPKGPADYFGFVGHVQCDHTGGCFCPASK